VVRLPADRRPILVTMIDAEEEFDWDAGFRRDNVSTTAIAELERAHEVFDPVGVRPVYVVDHPVATNADSTPHLRALHESGRCEIGAHLHPWLSPPFDEDVNHLNSFPGNLPPELEAAKLSSLTAAIEEHVGVRPRVYQAGRYGVGPQTAPMLERAGFLVDMSATPPFDYRPDGGPDFSSFSPEPYWCGPERTLLGLPLTGGFVGMAGGSGPGLYRLATRPGLSWMRLPALLSRGGLVERLRLSPEGYGTGHMRKLTMSRFHAPSLKPGCTPYVNDDRDRDRFLDTLRRYYDWFFGEFGGESMTALELRQHLLDLTTQS
jgi:hypothetical protein